MLGIQGTCDRNGWNNAAIKWAIGMETTGEQWRHRQASRREGSSSVAWLAARAAGSSWRWRWMRRAAGWSNRPATPLHSLHVLYDRALKIDFEKYCIVECYSTCCNIRVELKRNFGKRQTKLTSLRLWDKLRRTFLLIMFITNYEGLLNTFSTCIVTVCARVIAPHGA